jgi:hypothetical protein
MVNFSILNNIDIGRLEWIAKSARSPVCSVLGACGSLVKLPPSGRFFPIGQAVKLYLKSVTLDIPNLIAA